MIHKSELNKVVRLEKSFPLKLIMRDQSRREKLTQLKLLIYSQNSFKISNVFSYLVLLLD